MCIRDRAAGRCLVSAAERNGRTLLAVTLNDADDWNDHAALLDEGFAQYEPVMLHEAGDEITTLRAVSYTHLVKRLDLIALMRACRYHNHRQAGPFAQTAKDINTVHIRQAEVKDDQVRTVRGDHGHGLGTSPSLERLITV